MKRFSHNTQQLLNSSKQQQNEMLTKELSISSSLYLIFFFSFSQTRDLIGQYEVQHTFPAYFTEVVLKGNKNHHCGSVSPPCVTETGALHQFQNAKIYPKPIQLTFKILYRTTIHELAQIFLQPIYIVKLILPLGNNIVNITICPKLTF